ncbi:GP46-like surface antigen, putative, partial [Bodo saltans]
MPFLTVWAALGLVLCMPRSTLSTPMCGCEHRYSLMMDFYNATNGAGWTHNNGWSLTPASCLTNWYGVYCYYNDVQEIDLPNNNLTGTLPASLGNMSQLVQLSLSSNSITGTLPPEWQSFKLLRYLYLWSNSLSGTLPTEWSNIFWLIQL